MKHILTAIALMFLTAVAASAQTPVIIGPTSQLAWDTPGLGPALAATCTYQISQSSGPFSNVVGPVNCIAPVPPAVNTTCSVIAVSQPVLTIGSGSVQMTTTCSGQVSLPSTVFAYVVVVVPVPSNLRIK